MSPVKLPMSTYVVQKVLKQFSQNYMRSFRKYPHQLSVFGYLYLYHICMVCHHQNRRALEMFEMLLHIHKVRKGAKIMNRYNQVPHLTQDVNGKVTNSLLDIANESQEVSPFTAGDHKASINRRALTTRHQ